MVSAPFRELYQKKMDLYRKKHGQKVHAFMPGYLSANLQAALNAPV